MNGRESVSSFRSMEILSPEPPRELNIPVDDCEDAVRSSGDRKSRRSKSGKEKKSFETEEDQKLKRGLAKIQSNDLTLVELRARQMQIREETETLRKENAEGFYKLRHLLGKKGVSVLEDLYFKEYPDLVQQLEGGSSSKQGKLKDGLSSQRTPRDLVSASSSESNMTDVDERIFYQTEVLENENEAETGPIKAESLLGEEEDEELARLLERSEKRANFIERNKELAASGDILTKTERDRLEAILATEDEEERNTDTEIRNG